MFGYIITNGDLLEKEEKDRYQALYCGLCQRLGSQYGGSGRVTLTYDMTFLAMLLASLYEMDETSAVQRCPVNPLRKCPYVSTEATAYAADMNLVLAYYKSMDDWNDDHSVVALGQQKLLEKKVAATKERWPRQCGAVEACLKLLGEMEKENELNPDRPTNCFGALMAELFVMREDEWSEKLREMGAALGRFIYLMDARMDLQADIRRQRYNPLVAQLDTDFTPLLTMLIGECTAVFETLPLTRDVRILRNILYSGVWVKYKSKIEGQEKRHDRSV